MSAPATVSHPLAATPLRVLLLEQQAAPALRLRCAEAQCRLTTVASVREATAFLRDEGADIALIATGTPGPADLDAVTVLAARFSHLAIVAVIGEGDDQLAERFINAGAQDCVFADDPAPLRRTLRHAVVRKHAEQLRRDREAAESANRAKSAFLSQMSHELRTPLTAIMGFAQLLEMQLPDAEQELVRPILRAGRQLQRLIEEILDIARIDAGEVSLSLEPVQMAEVLDEALGLIGPLAAGRGIRLELTSCSNTDVHVLADRQRIAQVLLNLLSNAVKCEREGGQITVRCLVVNGRLRIEVQDTGVGLDPEQLAALLTPFNRVGDDLAVTGAGLGLVITRRLVEAMGGVIGLDSITGTGTTAWTEWTLVPDPALQPVNGRDGMGERELTGLILYIEDNFVNVSLVQTVLARHPGVRLISVMRGHLGIELAEEHQPDVILLDANLPDMTGEEALAQLRAGRETSGIPVVVLSADAHPTNEERMIARGAHAFVVKPFKIDELEAAIESALRVGNAT